MLVLPRYWKLYSYYIPTLSYAATHPPIHTRPHPHARLAHLSHRSPLRVSFSLIKPSVCLHLDCFLFLSLFPNSLKSFSPFLLRSHFLVHVSIILYFFSLILCTVFLLHSMYSCVYILLIFLLSHLINRLPFYLGGSFRFHLFTYIVFIPPPCFTIGNISLGISSCHSKKKLHFFCLFHLPFSLHLSSVIIAV